MLWIDCSVYTYKTSVIIIKQILKLYLSQVGFNERNKTHQFYQSLNS